jgi:hypothetical protein
MKQKLLKVVNIFLALDFLLLLTTAIFRKILIPRGLYFNFHGIPGFVFAFLVFCHIILNFKWIKATYFKKK